MDKILAAQPLRVPIMLRTAWDQEDIYGAIAVYKAIKQRHEQRPRPSGDGPWHHGQK